MNRTHYTTTDSPMGTTRIAASVVNDVWLGVVYEQLLLDKYLPMVVGTSVR
ncbi:MAG: hypothetical protein ACREMY_00295 [bacterium]